MFGLAQKWFRSYFFHYVIYIAKENEIHPQAYYMHDTNVDLMEFCWILSIVVFQFLNDAKASSDYLKLFDM